MDAARMHWDPFGRTVPAQRGRVKAPRNAIRFPAWLSSALVGIALVGFVWLLWAEIFGGGGAAVLPPAIVLGVGIGGALLVDMLGKGQQSRLYRYFLAAEKLNWSFRLAPAHVQGAPGLSGLRRPARGLAASRGQMPGIMAQALEKAEASRRSEGTISDTAASELQAVYKAIPELFKPRPGQPVSMTVEAEFWGEARPGLPFWMGVREAEMDTTFAASELKADAHGNSENQGALLMVVAAYGLDHDTGIRATIMAEALGDSRKDIKTESTQFNNRYYIAVRGPGSDETEMRLLRALSPATQTSLLDLWDRYRMQAIIDGATVYLSGYEPVNTRNEAILAQKLSLAVDGFAAAAISFKRYVE